MNRYVALLRGINIGGKNAISMTELKEEWNQMGYHDVVSVLNSGNVLFSTNQKDKEEIALTIQKRIQDVFSLEIPIFVISQEHLQECFSQAPLRWNTPDKEIYDNLIFLSPKITLDDFYDQVGPLEEAYEKAQAYKNVIFWSFDRKQYQKSRWWYKTASTDIRHYITIRTAHTVQKILRSFNR